MLILLGAAAGAEPGAPRRVLWSALLEGSSVEEVKAKFPQEFQWQQSDLPEAAADRSSLNGFVLKPSDQDVKEGLRRFQVGDGTVLSIPTFQFRRNGTWPASLFRVDLTVFSLKKSRAELRGVVQADLERTFGAARETPSGTLVGYGRMQYLLFEDGGSGRVVCLSLPQDSKLPLSITYSFPNSERDKWSPAQRC
jgi:hypothetical protein